MTDLSILIPARREEFLRMTVEDILKNKRGNTEIIVVCDGDWPDPPVDDHRDVTLIHHSEPIGQRAATNEAANLSDAKFVMKCDAHCSFDEGFDVKLMKDCEHDWTVLPRMHNLHVFDWVCDSCGHRAYQGPKPKKCDSCNNVHFRREILWRAKPNPDSQFYYFDTELRFKYWRAFKKRPEAKPDIAPTMSLLGACFMMHRARYWDLGGMDEEHGSWGQMGTEVACKSWLSGGQLLTNKKTWFAHLFRTQKGFGFPYRNTGVNRSRKYSRDLWMNNKWPGQIHDLEWLIEKFKPIPTWHDNETVKKLNNLTKGIIYYTDNHPEPVILESCQRQIMNCMKHYNFPIYCISQKPTNFGNNIVMDLQRSLMSMYKQILRGIEECKTDIIFMLEHDVIYHPSHFNFTPPDPDRFYYDRSFWAVSTQDGKAVFYHRDVPSMLCARRDLLLEHYSRRVKYVENNGHLAKLGFSPPKGLPKELRIGKSKSYMAEFPSIDIRHDRSLTRRRMNKDQFRSDRSCRGWTEADGVPGWGTTKLRFYDFLDEAVNKCQQVQEKSG